MLSAPAATRYLAERYFGRQRFSRALRRVPIGMASEKTAQKQAFAWETPQLSGHVLLEMRTEVLKSRMEFSAM